MRLIDAHVHLYPAELNQNPAGWAAARREPAWAELCTRVRRRGRPVQGFPALRDLLRDMDAAQVERSVLLGWYWANPESCEAQNRFYADCVRAHPDRLSAFATIQPLAGEAAVERELRRAREDGLVGLGELSPHAQRHPLDDPGFACALELAARWSWAVTLHVTDPATREYPGRVETPGDDFLRIAREHPQVTFVLAHWGGLLPLRDARAVDQPNLWFDTAASPLTYDESVWPRMMATVPPARILFGSDYPLNLYPALDAEPSMLRFAAEARRMSAPEPVVRGNALRLIGL